jgi:hypothetical protein
MSKVNGTIAHFIDSISDNFEGKYSDRSPLIML